MLISVKSSLNFCPTYVNCLQNLCSLLKTLAETATLCSVVEAIYKLNCV